MAGYSQSRDPTLATVPSSQMGNAAVCPPGMEYLLYTSAIMVKQQVEILEAFTGFETNNRYQVLDMAGRRIYLALEQSNCCFRAIFGSRRPFVVLLLNNMGGEVRVFGANDFYIGKICQNTCGCCCPSLTVVDAEENNALAIEGPCILSACCTVTFTVKNVSGEEVGQIQKKWGGLIKEAFTDADSFGVSFPIGMDPRLKTLLLGAVFLIDFMYFENPQDKSGGVSGAFM